MNVAIYFTLINNEIFYSQLGNFAVVFPTLGIGLKKALLFFSSKDNSLLV